MYKLRHYALVWTANGTIALPCAWFGPFEEMYVPVQMRNQRWQKIPQPYPDQPSTVRDARVHYNEDVWFINMQEPPPLFRWYEITAEQYRYVSNTPWCFWWDGAGITLRPGHSMNERRNGAFCQYLDYLILSHTAFGGMPVYQVRHWSKKRPEDFPAIRDAGLFHPWWKEPEPVTIHPALRAKRFALEEIQELTVQQRLRTPIAMAVKLEKQAQGLVVVPRGYVAGMGMN